jgi:hypothetical protein
MDDGAKAWLICEDMLTRIKDELVLEAIDILEAERKSGRVGISGYVPVMPEKGPELEENLFLINKILENTNSILDRLAGYEKELVNGSGAESATVERAEELRRFLMAVNAMEMLMDMSRVFGSWAEDMGKYHFAGSTEEILEHSIVGNGERVDALGFVLSSITFARSEALDTEEAAAFRNAYQKIRAS